MTAVTSKDNPKIKQVRTLLAQRKARDASGLFVAEGIRHVGEACASGAQVEYICYAPQSLTSSFAQELVRQQEQDGTPCLAVSEQVFNSLADKDNPAGILAVVRQPHLALEDLDLEMLRTGVALVAPQDPGNIGSILRSIDAARAGGLLLLDDPSHDQYCADPYHPSAVRASMGAIFWHPVVKTSFAAFNTWAKAHGFTVYGTSAHASLDYCHLEGYHQPLILLMGSERQGLHPDQASACDVMVKMPMLRRVTSLNLAAATAVMLYKILEKPA
jgi:TrmH family RNA methyltransferase